VNRAKFNPIARTFLVPRGGECQGRPGVPGTSAKKPSLRPPIFSVY